MWAVEVGTDRFVLRCGCDPTHEAAVLEWLAGTPLPTPRVVAAGASELLTTWLPGRVHIRPTDEARWLHSLDQLAAGVHQVTPPPWLPPYRRDLDPATVRPPEWAGDVRLWERAIEAAGPDPKPTGPDAYFIHRDFHPGNVLWERGRVSGLVDWVEACLGPPAVDAAHCRLNLAWIGGLELVERYPAPRDPYWEVVDIVDVAEWEAPTPDERDGMEAFLADALSRLG